MVKATQDYTASDKDMARFWAKVEADPNSGCWLWSGYCDDAPRDYGRFCLRGKMLRAHRVAYHNLISAVPLELEMDHLCRVKSCVNPSHLEPVTSGENTRRWQVDVFPREVCRRGHALVPENIRTEGLDRLCLTCARAADREWGRDNQHKRTDYMRGYRERNREKMRAAAKARYCGKKATCP